MSEHLPQPERPQLTEAQQQKLQDLCERYSVTYAPEHYYRYPDDSSFMAGWAEGWIGGPRHANPDYVRPEEPAERPTIFIGVSPEGEAHS